MKLKITQLTQQLTQALAQKSQIGEDFEKKLTVQNLDETKKQSQVKNLEEEIDEMREENEKLRSELVKVN